MSKTTSDLSIQPICIAIGGVSRSGKTFLSKMLNEKLYDSVIIHQDEYIPDKDTIPRINNHINWETPEAIDWGSFSNAIIGARKSHKFIIIEGLFVYHKPELNKYYDRTIFITISEKEFTNRKRNDFRWGREPEWYIQHIWKGHLLYGKLPEQFNNALVIDGEKDFSIDEIIQKLKILN
jgi:uridine kinase